MTTLTKKRMLASLLLIALTAAACGGDDESSDKQAETTTSTAATPTTQAAGDTINPADFTNKVDHPFFSLVAFRPQIFEGTEKDAETGDTIKTRGEKRLLDKTEVVAGVTVAVVEHKEFDDGELVEATFDYFAQHRDGRVFYFGERVDDYEDGKVVGHEGQWLAGEDNAKAGIYLPVDLTVGKVFAQEQAPGKAEDTSTIVAVGAEVTTKAGKFTGCLRVKDFAPLTKTEEFKFYCPKVGIVREEQPNGTSDLVRYG